MHSVLSAQQQEIRRQAKSRLVLLFSRSFAPVYQTSQILITSIYEDMKSERYISLLVMLSSLALGLVVVSVEAGHSPRYGQLQLLCSGFVRILDIYLIYILSCHLICRWWSVHIGMLSYLADF